MADQSTPALQGALHASGRRLTGQRRMLLQLIQAEGGHVDAHELFRLARKRNPRISLSTVYRTVALLRELGLIDELHLGEEHHHYEIRPVVMHHHLVCTNCGDVVEFQSRLTDALEGAVAREHGFEILDVHIEMTGLCSRCRASRRP